MAASDFAINKELIAAFQNHSCLWDLRCADYNDRDARRVALDDLGSALGHGVDDSYTVDNIKLIRSKIKLFRSHVARMLKEQKEASEKGLGDDTVPTTRHWVDYLQPLLRPHHVTHSKTNSNNTDCSKDPSLASICCDSKSNGLHLDKQNRCPSKAAQSGDVSKMGEPPAKRPKCQEEEFKVEKIDDELDSKPYHFAIAISVVEELSKMTPGVAKAAKREIQQVISESFDSE